MLDNLYNLATDKHKGPAAGIFKAFLWFISLIYGLIVRTLIFIRGLNALRPDCKVISVGNITLGGTGKTSLVLLIARYLKDKGHKVAIVSRGYKKSGAGSMGDEPYMLKMKLKDIPVIVDADRSRASRLAVREHGADTVILDDGMQQWGIKKDLEIVTIDSVSPFGNRNLIPRGILREPLSSLKRADIFVLTKSDLGADTERTRAELKRMNARALEFDSIHSPSGLLELQQPGELRGLEALSGKKAALFSAIGDPDSFELLAGKLGIIVGASFRFRDHHNYTQEDIDDIVRKARGMGIEALLTTEKDASRLYQLPVAGYGLPVWFLRVELKIIKDEEGFYNRLFGIYSR